MTKNRSNEKLIEFFTHKNKMIFGEDTFSQRGFYICHSDMDEFYLMNNGEITMGVSDNLLGFWKTEEEAKSFYKDWREKAIKHLKEIND